MQVRSKVHTIFHKYCSPFIKDYERFVREQKIDDREYIISGS